MQCQARRSLQPSENNEPGVASLSNSHTSNPLLAPFVPANEASIRLTYACPRPGHTRKDARLCSHSSDIKASSAPGAYFTRASTVCTVILKGTTVCTSGPRCSTRQTGLAASIRIRCRILAYLPGLAAFTSLSTPPERDRMA